MIEPSIDNLIDLVDSKYTLVVLAAKRAREVVNDGISAGEGKSDKPVTMALWEIASHKITYERTKVGNK